MWLLLKDQIRTFVVNTNTTQRLINPLDPIVPWITQKIQTILVFLIMTNECKFYFRNAQLPLYALISLLHVIPSAPHCLPSSMAFQSSQLYTLIHHSKWQLTCWVGVQEFTLQYVRGKRKNKWWLSSNNLIRTYFVNTNTRQRLINPLDPIVP